MSDNKRIAIARVIMYKELEKRREAREIECKRRGLWTLWKHQNRYKTLWHFLRAGNERLIMLCDECRFDLYDKISDYMNEMLYFEQLYNKDPCVEYEEPMAYYSNLYHRCTREYNELTILKDKITGGINNESQN